jgi:uncharacterized protein (TIGR00369 family)
MTSVSPAPLTGLELWQRVAAGELPPPPIARLLQFDQIDEIEAGRIVFAMRPSPDHLNPLQTVHGGVLTTLLDSAMGCAVHTTLPADELYTTVELKVNFLRPVLPEGDALRCEGRVLHRGATIALAEAQLFTAGGKLAAHATSTCLIRPLS